jgi:hypothetical protein
MRITVFPVPAHTLKSWGMVVEARVDTPYVFPLKEVLKSHRYIHPYADVTPP